LLVRSDDDPGFRVMSAESPVHHERCTPGSGRGARKPPGASQAWRRASIPPKWTLSRGEKDQLPLAIGSTPRRLPWSPTRSLHEPFPELASAASDRRRVSSVDVIGPSLVHVGGVLMLPEGTLRNAAAGSQRCRRSWTRSESPSWLDRGARRRRDTPAQR